MPWFQQRRQWEHCTFGAVSHNSNNSTLPKSLNHLLRIFAEWFVDVILLQVGMKCFSIRRFSIFFTSPWNRRCASSFTNCMWQSWHSEINARAPLFDPPMTGFPVPVWSSSTCLGVNTQRPVDSCPPTGLPVLVWSSSSYLSTICTGIDTQLWIDFDPSTGVAVLVECLVPSRPNKTSFSISWVNLLFTPFLIIGFLVLVGFVAYLCCFQWLLNQNHTSNDFCKKFSVVVEVTHVPSGIWFLQISSQLLSRYNKLGVYRRGWLRSILFDRTSILSIEQAVYRPNTPKILVHFPLLLVRLQDVVWSNQALADLGDSCAWDSRL